MLTEQDITKMKKIFLTKEDGKLFATKKDLETFATKKDLENFATKRDLKKLETKLSSKLVSKKDYDRDISYIIMNMATKQDIVLQNERFSEYDEKYDHLVTLMDRLMVPLSVLREEFAMSGVQYQRQVDWNHKVAEKVNVPFDY